MGNATSNGGDAGFRVVGGKRIIWALCLFAVAYGLLMTLWPIWGAGYVSFYRAGAALLFESPVRRARIEFSHSAETRDEIKVTFYDKRRGDECGRLAPLLRIAHDIRYGDYIYLAFLVALILATPIPARRKAWALLWGSILMHVFMAFRLGILILYLLNSEQVSLLALRWFWRQVLVLNMQVFTINILPGFVVAIFIWALVSLRRGDWARLVTSPHRVAGDKRRHSVLNR